MGLKSAISIYDILKKTAKTNPFDEINNKPYYQIPEFIYQKATIYQVSEITDSISEIARIYEIEALEEDIKKVLHGQFTKQEFEEKYSCWETSIPMFAHSMYRRFENMVKNDEVDGIQFYYLGVELTTKSDKISVVAIGIMILSQFQNDISEEILQTLSAHCRLSYYCVLAVSHFTNSTRILNRMMTNASSNATMIIALALNYESEVQIRWLLEYAIEKARDMGTLSYKSFKNPHIKKYLSNITIDENSFSALTKLLMYGIGKENIMQYSLYDSNFIAELLLKLLSKFETKMCRSLSDYWFLVMAMHLLTGMKDTEGEIQLEFEEIMTQMRDIREEEQLEIKRNIIKERIFINVLMHNDYLNSIYNIRMNIDPEEMEDAEIDELIEKLNEMMQSDSFNPLNPSFKHIMEDRLNTTVEFHEEDPDDLSVSFKDEAYLKEIEAEDFEEKKNQRLKNKLFFNESIKNACQFIDNVFDGQPQREQLLRLTKHSGNFEEYFTDFQGVWMDKKLEDIDAVFRNEAFLDNILDDIQYLNHNPYVYLPILALFNIIPEFPYFHKMIEDYPLSREFLNFAISQFPYYHTDLCEHALYFMKKDNLQEDIYTDQYVVSTSESLTEWVDAILEKYEEDDDTQLTDLDFLCHSFAFVSDDNIIIAVKFLKRMRSKMTNKHFEFLYRLAKTSERASIRRKLASFLGLTQAQIKSSMSFYDAIEKHKNSQSGSIIKLPKIKKK